MAGEEFSLPGADKHNLIYGTAYHSSTEFRYVVGWHPHYPQVVREPVTITASRAADIAERVITGNATSGAITVTLPSAVGIAGKRYVIRKSDASANTVTIDPAGAETRKGNTRDEPPSADRKGRDRDA